MTEEDREALFEQLSAERRAKRSAQGAPAPEVEDALDGQDDGDGEDDGEQDDPDAPRSDTEAASEAALLAMLANRRRLADGLSRAGPVASTGLAADAAAGRTKNKTKKGKGKRKDRGGGADSSSGSSGSSDSDDSDNLTPAARAILAKRKRAAKDAASAILTAAVADHSGFSWMEPRQVTKIAKADGYVSMASLTTGDRSR
jgi:hypothetical protein